MKIYFLRHTDADDDRRDSFGGIADDPLIEIGRDYARKVRDLFASMKIDAIYTSPYQRAKETAMIINEKAKASLIELYNLRERNSYGVLSGIEKTIAKALFPEISERIKAMKEDGKKPSNSVESLPGAEIYLELLLRIKDSLNQIFREGALMSYQNIIIVTHGGLSWALFNDILKENIELEKGEIMVLEGTDIKTLKIDQEATLEIKKLI